MRAAVAGGAITCAVALVLSGCGGGHNSSSSQSGTTANVPSTSPSAPPTPVDAVLAVPTVGGFYGRCPNGVREWTLRFVNSSPATDQVVYQLSGAARHPATVQPGQALNFTLTAAARLRMSITQATVPHTLRLNVLLSVAGAHDGTSRCTLVASRVSAQTQFH
jgi:hypothetical protein